MSDRVKQRLAVSWVQARQRYQSLRFARTYYRGAIAASQGRPVDACPYPRDPLKTWRNVYRQAWIDGWYSMQ